MFRLWRLVQAAALCGLLVRGQLALGAPVQSDDEMDTDEDVPRAQEKNPKQVSIDYFSTYGYLPDGQSQSQSSMLEEAYEQALLDFQEFMGLEQTGKLDAKTSELIGKARCGNKDPIKQHDKPQYSRESVESTEDQADGRRRRRKRAEMFGPKWPTSKLVYRIASYPEGTGDQQDKVDQIFESAFNIWSQAANLKFERTSNQTKADFEIKFLRDDDHGNCLLNSFSSTVLAHAHRPTPARQKNYGIHFNSYFDWFNNRSLLATAIHEIGHSLGLSHSMVPDSIMSPYHKPREDLHEDDKISIELLYGPVSKIKQFYVIPKKWLNGTRLHMFTERKDSLEECAKYALDNQLTLAVFDKETKQCNGSISWASSARRHLYATYTNKGVGVTVHSLRDHTTNSTQSSSDVENWIANNKCDSIVWISKIDTYYMCRQYDFRESSTMLMKLDGTRRNEHILDLKQPL